MRCDVCDRKIFSFWYVYCACDMKCCSEACRTTVLCAHGLFDMCDPGDPWESIVRKTWYDLSYALLTKVYSPSLDP